MTVPENIERDPSELDPVEERIAEDERRRSGAFLRDYLTRYRIENDRRRGHPPTRPATEDQDR